MLNQKLFLFFLFLLFQNIIFSMEQRYKCSFVISEQGANGVLCCPVDMYNKFFASSNNGLVLPMDVFEIQQKDCLYKKKEKYDTSVFNEEFLEKLREKYGEDTPLDQLIADHASIDDLDGNEIEFQNQEWDYESVSDLVKRSKKMIFEEFSYAFHVLMEKGCVIPRDILNILAGENPKLIPGVLQLWGLKEISSTASVNPLDSLGYFDGSKEDMELAFNALIEGLPYLIKDTNILNIMSRYNPELALHLIKIYPKKVLKRALLYSYCCFDGRQRETSALDNFRKALRDTKITTEELAYVEKVASKKN